MPEKLGTINLFLRDGVSIIETEHGKISVTLTQVIEGWQGRRPPFGNGEVQLRNPLPSGLYDVAAWFNDEVKARWNDASGRRQTATVERRGEPVSYANDPTPPADAERQRVTSLSVAFSTPREQQQPQQQAQPQQNVSKPGAIFDE